VFRSRLEATKSLAAPGDQLQRIAGRLATLDAAKTPEDMNIAGYHFHRPAGDMKGFYSVRVTGNWRIVFRFEDGDAFDVDHLDYH
jgi:proteic killer suppression protein